MSLLEFPTNFLLRRFVDTGPKCTYSIISQKLVITQVLENTGLKHQNVTY